MYFALSKPLSVGLVSISIINHLVSNSHKFRTSIVTKVSNTAQKTQYQVACVCGTKLGNWHLQKPGVPLTHGGK